MKKTFIVLILLTISLISSGTTYYVSTAANGGSNSNSGSAGSPWLTLHYACESVTSSGNTIHVNAGSFIETEQATVAVGVSIEGAGQGSTFIISRYAPSREGIRLPMLLLLLLVHQKTQMDFIRVLVILL
jgi:hypothetical protein